MMSACICTVNASGAMMPKMNDRDYLYRPENTAMIEQVITHASDQAANN